MLLVAKWSNVPTSGSQIDGNQQYFGLAYFLVKVSINIESLFCLHVLPFNLSHIPDMAQMPISPPNKPKSSTAEKSLNRILYTTFKLNDQIAFANQKVSTTRDLRHIRLKISMESLISLCIPPICSKRLSSRRGIRITLVCMASIARSASSALTTNLLRNG